MSNTVHSLTADGNARIQVGNNIYATENRCLADLRITDPRLDKKRIEQTKGGMLANVHRCMLANDDFQRWRHDRQSRLMWIRGDAGKGKTMLLCGIIDELSQSTDRHLVSYFFCQGTDARLNNAVAVLRGLLYMLVRQQPCLVSHVRKRYDVAGKQLFEDVNAWTALCEIFDDMLHDVNLLPTFLIVDALDECESQGPQLLDWIVSNNTTSAPVKWIVASRNSPDIQEQLLLAGNVTLLSLELNATFVNAAVELYIRDKVRLLALKKGYDEALNTAVQRYLMANASGTFLWVALVCQNLERARTSSTLKLLVSSPPGLDSLYASMMQQVLNTPDTEDKNMCMRILAVAATVYRPVTLEELKALVGLDNVESLKDIVWLCGSFLAIREQTIYLVHQSVKDFFSKNASAFIFPCGTSAVHWKLFCTSLQIMESLRRDVYGLGNPGVSIEDVGQPEPDPLAPARYSCLYWVDHLDDAMVDEIVTSDRDLERDDRVYDFLSNKYLYWLEALSLIRGMPQGMVAMTKLQTLLETSNRPRVVDLVRDASRFTMSFGWAIGNAPLQAYASALVFCPRSSITRKMFARETPDWVVANPTTAIAESWRSACMATFEGHHDIVNSLAFFADGQRLLSASSDGTIKMWDPTTSYCLATLQGSGGWVNSVAVSPGGQLLAGAQYDGIVKIWDAAKSHTCLVALEGHDDSVTSVAFSPDGQRLASASDDKTIRIWDITNSHKCLGVLRGHGHWVRSVAFSPDGLRLASASSDKTVRIWDATMGYCLTTLHGHGDAVLAVAFSPNNQRLASASSCMTVKIWDATTGDCLATLDHDCAVSSVAFSPDGQRLASASGLGIKVWDATTGLCLKTLRGHGASVRSVAFSPEGRRIASASDDRTVKIWDPTVNHSPAAQDGHVAAVSDVILSPDRTRAVSASNDGVIKIWDTATGQCLTLEGHGGWISSMALSPDMQRLASASWDRDVKVWDAKTGRHLMTIDADCRIFSLRFDETGTRLLTDAGTLDLGQSRPSLQSGEPESPRPPEPAPSLSLLAYQYQGYHFSADRAWIKFKGQNLLWLPSEYRAHMSVVGGSTAVLTYGWGRILILRFPREAPT
ncbi:hypothetical protein HIM_08312 [Hirsutella minnesotensis 3608]|uniref:NACHT domain-containing protein n=1 Tax=Hirsutella minnesotensis 3608 TaxID=1043627 RepID=A0A0F7ZH99_9HYPO|nr:hypothetical protein HIM_08312 [Hirsutella minnesotensis 3608]